MKFSINQSELQQALSVVVKGSSTRSTLSILAGVYIQANQDCVTLQTTNLELSIKMTIPALIEVPGETVAPAKLLLDIIKNLPDMAVSITSEDSDLMVFCNNTSYSLKTLNPQDFPTFPEISVEQQASFPFTTFANMVKSTAKIVSHDETRAILTGVLISQEGTTLKMVATDSYRLAVDEVALPQEAANDFEAVVSGAFLQDIAGLPNSNEPITLALNDNQIIITYGSITYINRRIEGRFPNYKQLIMDGYSTRATLNTSEFIAAVRRVSLLSNKVSPVVIHIDTDANIITLTTNSQEVGKAQETIMCAVEGESVEIAFNFQFLLDGLASIPTDEVNLDLFGSMKPGILRAQGDTQFLHLIMPVRV